jgi:hypothetical protein
MLPKALARSEPNRAKFIALPFNRAAGHVAAERSRNFPLRADLEWRRIVSGKRHEIDCSAKGQSTVIECIGAPKDLCMTERSDIKIPENAFAVPLVEVQGRSSKNITPSGSSSDVIPDPRIETLKLHAVSD